MKRACDGRTEGRRPEGVHGSRGYHAQADEHSSGHHETCRQNGAFAAFSTEPAPSLHPLRVRGSTVVRPRTPDWMCRENHHRHRETGGGNRQTRPCLVRASCLFFLRAGALAAARHLPKINFRESTTPAYFSFDCCLSASRPIRGPISLFPTNKTPHEQDAPPHHAHVLARCDGHRHLRQHGHDGQMLQGWHAGRLPLRHRAKMR